MSDVKSKLDALKSAFDKKPGEGRDDTWKLFYPFWKIPEESTAIVRFLPDLDPNSDLQFLVEKLEHELVINGERKHVPCLEMFGEDCPICAESRKHYAEKNEVLGKKYYRKKSYIGQVIVIDSPIEHDQSKLVKLIDFGPAIFNQIQSAFKSGDLEEVPYDFKGGYNFRIKKTKSGQYASYSTSSFAPKQTALDDSVIDALELYNLADYRGKKMDVAAVEALLIAEKTGSSSSSSSSSSAPKPSDNTAQANTAVTTTTAPAAEPSTKGMSVLEQLRARAATRSE